MKLDRARQLALVAEAARAPSAHNCQPARWSFADDTVTLHECVSRRLAAADPSGRDHAIALGAAWEGMAIALSRHGLRLDAPRRLASSSRDIRPYASASVIDGNPPDPLAGAIDMRRCHRDTFAPAATEAHALLDAWAARWPQVRLVRDTPELARIGSDYDAAAAAGLRDGAMARELHEWMRFSPSDPRWHRDGLSATCLALSPFEAWGARLAMQPAVLRVIARLGLAGALVSEAAKVRSATAVALISAAKRADPFDIGRALYRLWLDLAAAGFAAVPMSALADSPGHARELARRHALADRDLVNVLRVGPAPVPAAPLSARLPAEELLVTTA